VVEGREGVLVLAIIQAVKLGHLLVTEAGVHCQHTVPVVTLAELIPQFHIISRIRISAHCTT
jgi:hypothetical protein